MGRTSSARARKKSARSPLLALALSACGGAITEVVCIVAGNGRVQLEVRGVRRAGRLVLNTTGEPRESPVDSHRIRLHDLRPDPLAGQPIPPEAYEIDLEVIPD